MRVMQEKKEEFNKIIRQYIEDTNKVTGCLK